MKAPALNPLSPVSDPETLPEGFYPPEGSAPSAHRHEETPEPPEPESGQEHEEEFLVQAHAHVVPPWSYYGEFQAVLEDQEAHLARCKEQPGTGLLGHASVHAEFEIGFSNRRHYFGLPEIAPDELIVLVAVKGQKSHRFS